MDLGRAGREQAEGDREMQMGDIIVRVSDAYALDLHLDTDEANAANLGNDSVVAFDGVQQRATRVTPPGSPAR